MINIHSVIARIGKDPKLLDELLAKQDETERKKTLVKHGLLGAQDKGPSRKEVEAELVKMLTPAGAPSPAPTGQRAVEWVAAIGTAAAGAAAGACSGDS
ncbi:hypothetical protein [Sorangium sp. So ce1000]|uniref:hypothetical protein n=1 Tax=Sorangium sp. So ce1000 TaxID=3133325 RepID=UPI003F5FF4CA